MGLFNIGRGRLSGFALMMGVWLAPSCDSLAQPAEPFPPVQTLAPVQPPPPAEALPPDRAAVPPQPAPPPPPAPQDWRTMRPLDLPVQLVRATWSEKSYLSQVHAVRFGRTSVSMQMSGFINKTIVKASRNAVDGLLVENLSCYNSVNGDRKCALLLNPPDQCYLLLYAESGAPPSEKPGTFRNESFDVLCPASLTLAR
jgi:hypothetical protein